MNMLEKMRSLREGNYDKYIQKENIKPKQILNDTKQALISLFSKIKNIKNFKIKNIKVEQHDVMSDDIEGVNIDAKISYVGEEGFEFNDTLFIGFGFFKSKITEFSIESKENDMFNKRVSGDIKTVINSLSKRELNQILDSSLTK